MMLSESPLTDTLDGVVERLIGLATTREWPHPMRSWLRGARSQALSQIRSRYLPRARALWSPLQKGDPGAIQPFEALVDEAMAQMRAQAEQHAGAGWLGSLRRPLESSLYRDGQEHIDDPGFSREARAGLVRLLDRTSRLNGSYARLLSLAQPLLDLARAAPVPHLLDVASGAGGFARYVSEQRPAGSLLLEASDIDGDYVAQGEARARARGLPIRFRVFDALDLAGPCEKPDQPEQADVLTCLHALHHFSPGKAARLLAACARAARTGVVILDGERRLSTWFVTWLGAMYIRNRDFQHDAVVSARRLYVQQEVELLCALAPLPPGTRIETGITPPAHLYVRLFKGGPCP